MGTHIFMNKITTVYKLFIATCTQTTTTTTTTNTTTTTTNTNNTVYLIKSPQEQEANQRP